MDNAAPRALTLHTAHLATNYPIAIQNVHRMEFDTRTDTLLLLVSKPILYQWDLVSLSCIGSKWIEVRPSRTNEEGDYPTGDCTLHVVYNVSIRSRSECELWGLSVRVARACISSSTIVIWSHALGLITTLRVRRSIGSHGYRNRAVRRSRALISTSPLCSFSAQTCCSSLTTTHPTVHTITRARALSKKRELFAAVAEHSIDVRVWTLACSFSELFSQATYLFRWQYDILRICRIESLIIVECPTITIESM